MMTCRRLSCFIILFSIPPVKPLISTFYNILRILSFFLECEGKAWEKIFLTKLWEYHNDFPSRGGVKQHGNCTMVNPSVNLCFINKLSWLDVGVWGSSSVERRPNISIGSQIDVRGQWEWEERWHKFVEKCKWSYE